MSASDRVKKEIAREKSSIQRFFEHIGGPIIALFDPRVLWTAIPALIVLAVTDFALIKAVCTLFLFVLIATAIAHWVRKTLFPYVDIETLVKAAGTNAIAAAIVLCAVLLFTLGIVYLVLQAGMR